MQMYTRHKHYLHKPTVNLSCFQKNTFYAGINIFNNPPLDHESLMNEKAPYKITLKQYINTLILHI
jgi:hypothetical protein